MTPSARIVPGLPTYGESALGFSATGHGLHAQGLVVEISPDDGPSWIGNFVRGLSAFDFAELHPNARNVLVIAGGQGYVVDAKQRGVTEMFGAAIVDVIRHPARDWLIFNDQEIRFSALGPDGWVWKSRRVSWDGFRDLHVEAEHVIGEAWSPGDSWEPFKVNLNTGEVAGGSYPEHVPGA